MASLQTHGEIYYDYDRILKMYLGNTCIYSKPKYPDPFVEEGKMWVYYDVTTTESATPLLYRNTSTIGFNRAFSSMEIDDGTIIELGNSTTNNIVSYTFSTTGEHLVKFVLLPNTYKLGNMFRNSSGIETKYKRVYIPSEITTLGIFSYGVSGVEGVYNTQHITTFTDQMCFLFSPSDPMVQIAPLDLSGATTLPNNMVKGTFGNLILNNNLTTITEGWCSTGGNSSPLCTKFVIPESVTTIGSNFLWRSYYVRYVICKPTTPPTLGSGSFNGLTDFKILVPANSVNAYKEATGWTSWASKIEAIPEDYVY